MRPHTFAALDAMLKRIGAAAPAWQVQAMFFGAMASTNLHLGPTDFLDRILGPDALLGRNRADANANLQVLGGFWNRLNADRLAGKLRLSRVPLSKPPTVAQLRAVAERRHDEVEWFIKGIDAGGGDPAELGEKAKRLFRGLALHSSHCKQLVVLLDREAPPKREAVALGKTLAEATATLQVIMLGLAEIADAIRHAALDAFQSGAGSATDDGLPVRRAPTPGRNDPCPCGSGSKWKKCHGATKPPGAALH